jgi:hypothetical protein
LWSPTKTRDAANFHEFLVESMSSMGDQRLAKYKDANVPPFVQRLIEDIE